MSIRVLLSPTYFFVIFLVQHLAHSRYVINIYGMTSKHSINVSWTSIRVFSPFLFRKRFNLLKHFMSLWRRQLKIIFWAPFFLPGVFQGALEESICSEKWHQIQNHVYFWSEHYPKYFIQAEGPHSHFSHYG